MRKRNLLIYLLSAGVFLFITNNCRKSDDTSKSTLTDIDKNVYKIVKIGEQWWMAENLKTTKYNDGTDIPLANDNPTWYNLSGPCYSWYETDSATYAQTYGALYKWYTVSTGILCPTGWHVPTDAEWTILTDYLGGESVAGRKLKEAGTTHWRSSNDNATNESGFTALPAGFRGHGGASVDIGSFSIWWSASEDTATYAYYRNMIVNDSVVYKGSYKKGNGLSIRCVKD